MRKVMMFLMVLGLVLGVSYAFAGDGAEVFKDVGCNVPDGQGFVVFTEDSQAVVTPSGNTKLTCKAQLDEAFWPEKAYHDSGFFCITYLGTTTNSRVVITPSGNAILTCMVKAPKI